MYHEEYQHASNLGANVPDAHHLPCLHDSLQTVQSHNLLRYLEQLQSETLTLRQVIITMSRDHSATETNTLGEYLVNMYKEYSLLYQHSKLVFTPCEVGRLREHQKYFYIYHQNGIE